jgi:hypothetical protein
VRLASIAVGAVLLVAAPGGAPARADAVRPPTVVLTDGPGDVWRFSDAEDVGYQPAARPEADVLRARVTHGPYAVGVRLAFDDLQRVDAQWYYCDVRTPAGTANFILEAEDGHWRGRLWQDVQGEWVHVRGTRHHIDYRSDVVTMHLARTLLGNPPWVRVRLHNVLGLADHSTFFTDNPSTAGVSAKFTRRLPAP